MLIRWDDHCATCEVLKESLALERARVSELMRLIIPNTNPNTSARPDEISPPKLHIPWKVKRQMLEEQHKVVKPIEELEKEIGIT